MKLIFFAISLVSFVMYRAAKSEVNLMGEWNGSYMTMQKKVGLKIIFGKDNSVSLYSGEIKKAIKAIGHYKINKSNEVLMTCKWIDGSDVSLRFTGRLNPERNIIDGEWISDDHISGSFYFEKSNGELIK